MTNDIQINVPMPLNLVVKRLEDGRKEMAPKIGICTVAPDNSWFVCSVSHGYVFALLRGDQEKPGETTISVKTRLLPFKPLIITGVMFIFLSILFDAFVGHPKTIWDWLSSPAFIATIMIIPILSIPISKRVLNRFIRETLVEESNTK